MKSFCTFRAEESNYKTTSTYLNYGSVPMFDILLDLNLLRFRSHYNHNSTLEIFHISNKHAILSDNHYPCYTDFLCGYFNQFNSDKNIDRIDYQNELISNNLFPQNDII